IGTPGNPWLCQARRVGEARTPMALGQTPLPTAHDRLLAQDAEWWAQPTRCRRPQGSHNSPVVERWLCSIPWQGDFPRGNVPTVKGALSVRWKLNDRPISMKLYEFAAIDRPEQTSAPEMHQRIIAMATEQSPSIPAQFSGALGPVFGRVQEALA